MPHPTVEDDVAVASEQGIFVTFSMDELAAVAVVLVVVAIFEMD